MIVTEQEARRKFCPYLLSNPQVSPKEAGCKGTDCMLWRQTTAMRDGVNLGYCGFTNSQRPKSVY